MRGIEYIKDFKIIVSILDTIFYETYIVLSNIHIYRELIFELEKIFEYCILKNLDFSWVLAAIDTEKIIKSSKELDDLSKKLKIICRGLEKKIDVSWYANYRFNFDQAYEIYAALSDNIDVSSFAIPSLKNHQMYYIRLGLSRRFDISELTPLFQEGLNKDEVKMIYHNIVDKRYAERNLLNN